MRGSYTQVIEDLKQLLERYSLPLLFDYSKMSEARDLHIFGSNGSLERYKDNRAYLRRKREEMGHPGVMQFVRVHHEFSLVDPRLSITFHYRNLGNMPFILPELSPQNEDIEGFKLLDDVNINKIWYTLHNRTTEWLQGFPKPDGTLQSSTLHSLPMKSMNELFYERIVQWITEKGGLFKQKKNSVTFALEIEFNKSFMYRDLLNFLLEKLSKGELDDK